MFYGFRRTGFKLVFPFKGKLVSDSQQPIIKIVLCLKDFKNKINRARKIIEQNRDILTKVVLQNVLNSLIVFIYVKKSSSKVFYRIDYDEIIVSLDKIEFKGYSKWNEGSLTVNLNSLMS